MTKQEKETALTQQIIERKIFTLRETHVVLDKDLAAFYEVKPIRLREHVKRNVNRFPDDFVFQLTDAEVDLLVSQNAIPSRQALGGYLPYVFTEQGVAAVSAVLKSDKAAEVSILMYQMFQGRVTVLHVTQLPKEKMHLAEQGKLSKRAM